MAYIPLQPIVPQFMDENGDPMSSGTLYCYKAGTSTATALYSDSTGTSLGSSVTINSRGYPESGGNVVNLYRDAGIAIKLVLKDSDGATVWTADNLPTSANFDSNSSDKLSGIEAGADVTDATNVGAVVLGRETTFLPATLWYNISGDPAGTPVVTEATAGLANYYGFPFDATGEEHIECEWALPKKWNKGVLRFRVVWTSADTGTDGVSWKVRGRFYQDGDDTAAGWGTSIAVDDACQSGAGKNLVTAESADLTLGGNPANHGTFVLRVTRDVNNANDTSSVDATFKGLMLYWDADALNDD